MIQCACAASACRLQFRTSYFPGLGWMLRRELWEELAPRWPRDHWDHWMRVEDTARGRECVAPEVPRNRNIGEVGANMNAAAFRRYIAAAAFFNGSRAVDWGDLSALLQPAYTAGVAAAVAGAELWKLGEPLRPGGTYLVPYRVEEYARLARYFRVWPYPRGHHRHVASVPFRGARVLLADRRFCPLLPAGERVLPAPGLTPVAAKRAQHCHEACAGAGLRCQPSDFWFLNNCTGEGGGGGMLWPFLPPATSCCLPERRHEPNPPSLPARSPAPALPLCRGVHGGDGRRHPRLRGGPGGLAGRLLPHHAAPAHLRGLPPLHGPPLCLRPRGAALHGGRLGRLEALRSLPGY